MDASTLMMDLTAASRTTVSSAAARLVNGGNSTYETHRSKKHQGASEQQHLRDTEKRQRGSIAEHIEVRKRLQFMRYIEVKGLFVWRI